MMLHMTSAYRKPTICWLSPRSRILSSWVFVYHWWLVTHLCFHLALYASINSTGTFVLVLIIIMLCTIVITFVRRTMSQVSYRKIITAKHSSKHTNNGGLYCKWESYPRELAKIISLSCEMISLNIHLEVLSKGCLLFVQGVFDAYACRHYKDVSLFCKRWLVPIRNYEHLSSTASQK